MSQRHLLRNSLCFLSNRSTLPNLRTRNGKMSTDTSVFVKQNGDLQRKLKRRTCGVGWSIFLVKVEIGLDSLKFSPWTQDASVFLCHILSSSHCRLDYVSRWWFQIFLIFTPICGRLPFWLIFFKWVGSTTNFIYVFNVLFFCCVVVVSISKSALIINNLHKRHQGHWIFFQEVCSALGQCIEIPNRSVGWVDFLVRILGEVNIYTLCRWIFVSGQSSNGL